jgi:Transposase DDE domain group 1
MVARTCRSRIRGELTASHEAALFAMAANRSCVPRSAAEFTTLRMRLIKIAARIVETASRVRLAFAAAHPEAALFASLARYL